MSLKVARENSREACEQAYLFGVTREYLCGLRGAQNNERTILLAGSQITKRTSTGTDK